MIVLSHRGYWKTEEEQNGMVAFERSFSSSFGTETDVRDYRGELVISHDIANENCITVDRFLQVYSSYKNPLTLAFNIKADGLHQKLMGLLQKYKITNYFVFDMSVPNGLLYLKQNLRVFTRQSEFEMQPSFYESAQGVWLDEFNSHWITDAVIRDHINRKKQVCIVSPELHSRGYEDEWVDYKNIDSELLGNDIMICTDFPDEARSFFNGHY